MNLFLYLHGGSGNHGCEAIVRGTKQIFTDEKLTLYSNCKTEDEKYQLNKIVELQNLKTNYKKTDLKRIVASILVRIFKNENYAIKISVDNMVKKHSKGDIGLSIGGDNYCYPGFEEFGIINKCLKKKGIKTVLWGCSVEPSMINDVMTQDLLSYDLIVARESITYDSLKNFCANVVLAPDPAFQLKPSICKIPFGQNGEKVVGINISPHIIRCEKEKGIAYKNYVELIRYILDNTNYQIALIPHVVWRTNDDRDINNRLYNEFQKDNRITVVQDHNCEELKYIISQCDLFVGARTHATIAAYSSCVPTLVVGYSVKARGIAKDLFGTEENYVLPVQNIKDSKELVKAFKWLSDREDEIRTELKKFIPGYVEKGKKTKDLVLNLK